MNSLLFYDGIKYIVFIFFSIYLPGIFVAKVLTDSKNILRLTCLGSALGYCIFTLTCMLLKITHLSLFWVYLPIAFIYLQFLIFNKTILNKKLILRKNIEIFFLIILVTILYVISNSHLSKFFPDGSIVSPDQLFHLGLISELKKNWPITDPMLSNIELKYPFFLHLLIASSSVITGIEHRSIFFYFNYPSLIILIALNSMLISKLFTNEKFILVLVMVLLFFSGPLSFLEFYKIIYRIYTLSTEVMQITGLPLSSDIFIGSSPSLILGLVIFLPLIYETILYASKDSKSSLIVLGILIAGSTLVKGSFIPIYIVGLFLIYFYSNIKKTEFNQKNIIKLNILSISIFIYLYFVYFHGGIGSNHFIKIKLFNYFDDYYFNSNKPPLIDILQKLFILKFNTEHIFLLTKLFQIFEFVLVNYGILLISIFSFFLTSNPFNKRRLIAILLFILSGLLISNTFMLVDNNEMQFYYAVNPLITILSGIGIGHLLTKDYKTNYFLVYRFLAAAIITVSIVNGIYALYKFNKKYFDANISLQNERFEIHSPTYAAQLWIKSNTSSTAIIAVNIFAYENADAYKKCNYSANTERMIFLECAHYNRLKDKNQVSVRIGLLKSVFFLSDESALLVMKNKFQVTHLIVENSDGHPVKLPYNHLELVYQNSDVHVYSIRQ